MANDPTLLKMISSKNAYDHMVDRPDDAIMLFSEWLRSIRRHIHNFTIWCKDVSVIESVLGNKFDGELFEYDSLIKMAAMKSGLVTSENYKNTFMDDDTRHESIISAISTAWNHVMQ